MTTATRAFLALTLGSLAGLATMVMHPTGSHVMANAAAGGANWRNAFAHGLAIGAQPLLLLGTLFLTTRLTARRDAAVSAFVFHALSVVAVLIAAVASGFIAPTVMRGVGDAAGAQRDAILSAFHYTGVINQAFAKISVGFASVAILLWSWAMLGSAASRILAGFGMITSALALLGVVTGSLRLDIHGFGAVVLAQSVWMVWTGAWLRRQAAT
jgi:hypothetical protein